MQNELTRNRSTGWAGRFFDSVIRYRYLLALIVFVILVLFKVNGSSVGMWDNYVGGSSKTIVAGQIRAIRSDEWEVLTPNVLAQSNSDKAYPLINQNIGTSGENMLISLGMPVWDIYTISKPLNWGYLLFGSDYGLSWYWNMKWLLILLLSFELCMIITKKNRAVSSVGAFWLMLAPAVQWWFAQHVGDILLYTEAIVVTFYYFWQAKNIRGRALFAFLFSLSCIGYVCPLYPPFQISFGYLALFLMGAILIDQRRTIRIKKLDVLIIGAAAAFALLVLVHVYLVSKGAIHALSDTVYPGQRNVHGGDAPNFSFFNFLTNLYLPYQDTSLLNNCEISAFFNFLPAVILIFPLLIRKKTGNLKFGIPLAVHSLAFVFFMYCSIPNHLAKILLLNYVTGTRAVVAYSFSGALLSIWALSEISRPRMADRTVLLNGGVATAGDRKPVNRRRIQKGHVVPRFYVCIICTVVGTSYFAAVLLTDLKKYVPFLMYLPFLVTLILLNYFLLRGRVKTFSVVMLCVIFIAGVTVNPVNIGTGALSGSALAKEIRAIDSKDPGAVWLPVNKDDGSGAIGAFIYANGAVSLGGINAIPDIKKWEKIDPSGQYNGIYNRSAHVQFDIVTTPTRFELISPDAFMVHINVNDLQRLAIKYVVTKQSITTNGTSNVTFTKLYASSASQYSIYQVAYS